VSVAAAIVAVAFGCAMLSAPLAGAAPSAATQIKTLYKSVMLAEYFGPESTVCSHLTTSGVKAYTGGLASCAKTFSEVQHTLRHKTKDVDDSGYTAGQWRTVVAQVLKTLKVKVSGSHATATDGGSGIPAPTKLTLVGGSWTFSSAPPSIES
jgi:hypothetical protein